MGLETLMKGEDSLYNHSEIFKVIDSTSEDIAMFLSRNMEYETIESLVEKSLVKNYGYDLSSDTIKIVTSYLYLYINHLSLGSDKLRYDIINDSVYKEKMRDFIINDRWYIFLKDNLNNLLKEHGKFLSEEDLERYAVPLYLGRALGIHALSESVSEEVVREVISFAVNLGFGLYSTGPIFEKSFVDLIIFEQRIEDFINSLYKSGKVSSPKKNSGDIDIKSVIDNVAIDSFAIDVMGFLVSYQIHQAKRELQALKRKMQALEEMRRRNP